MPAAYVDRLIKLASITTTERPSSHDIRNADAGRLRNAFKARRYVDSIAEDIVAINDNVANIDANTELDLLPDGTIGISFRHRALNVDGATNRIDCTCEFYYGRHPP